MTSKPHTHKGFTYIEVLVAITILLGLLSLVYANFRRANVDSGLQKEASLLMSRIRYTQEITAAGVNAKFCQHWTGRKCATDADCTPISVLSYCCPVTGQNCTDASISPPGGYALTFSCPVSAGTIWEGNSVHDMPLLYKAESIYSLYADRQSCYMYDLTASNSCFPPNFSSMSDNAKDGLEKADGVISSVFTEQSTPAALDRVKGDTFQEYYSLGSSISIVDIRVTATQPLSYNGLSTFSCGEPSPWQGKDVQAYDVSTGTQLARWARVRSSTGVVENYPIQATIRFAPPDGRKVAISDNISQFLPKTDDAQPDLDFDNPWAKVEIMLGAKNRETDCKVVQVTKEGAISSYTDANCTF
jgi:prepilin-type N-terminal cleavage/methylation domain-containing protein